MSVSLFLNTSEAAARVGLSKGTLERMRIRGDGPEYHVVGSRKVFYDPGTLETWAKSRNHKSTSEYVRVA